jgi:hypothetical protein
LTARRREVLPSMARTIKDDLFSHYAAVHISLQSRHNKVLNVYYVKSKMKACMLRPTAKIHPYPPHALNTLKEI